MTPSEAGAVVLVSAGLAGFCAGRSWGRIALSGIFLIAALVSPWFIHPEHTFWRALTALYASFAVGRTADILKHEGEAPARWRVGHMFSLIDTRLIRRGRPRLPWEALFRLAVAAGVAFSALRWLPQFTLGRWAVGLVFIYALVEAVAAGFLLLLSGLGLRSPPLHVDPILSRSVRQFWAERWNRVVSRLLASHIFIPLARRGSRGLGLLLCFAVSGLGHGYFTWVAAGPRQALAMTAFFLVQWPAIMLERLLKVERWGSVGARLWTVSVMLAASPLFVFPALGCVGR